jgi:inorganic pyrophosphatase/exopolyphosphatase
MPAEREKFTRALREQRRDETDKIAAELIDADLKAKREKTERLRLARLAAQATGPGAKVGDPR